MSTRPLRVLKVIGASIAIGLASGFFVAGFNGFISGFFNSAHYITNAQSDRFIIGTVLAYAVLFIIASVAHIYLLTNEIPLFYPLSGSVMMLTAMFWRSFGSQLGTIDCGNSCVDTVVPLSAQNSATHISFIVLVGLFFMCCTLYLLRLRRKHANIAQPLS
jgi:hypothetical protein